MRKIVVSEFVSLDGVMEDPGGAEGYAHGGWTFKFSDPGQDAYKLQEVRDHDALLLGRVTYEGFARAWPTIEDPLGFADKMNSMPKYVVSSTLTHGDWNNTTVIKNNPADALSRLREQPGGDMLVAGSGTLVRWLLANDLVDELRLMVFPIVLGSGKRLFGEDPQARPLRLTGEQRLDSGTMILTYEIAR
jgi:dihydrofolate reductase